MKEKRTVGGEFEIEDAHTLRVELRSIATAVGHSVAPIVIVVVDYTKRVNCSEETKGEWDEDSDICI